MIAARLVVAFASGRNESLSTRLADDLPETRTLYLTLLETE
jgi:hypothetical protein